jgi:hypothetical protein
MIEEKFKQEDAIIVIKDKEALKKIIVNLKINNLLISLEKL